MVFCGMPALAALGVLALTRGASASVVQATALVGAAGGALEAAGQSRHRWQGVAAPVYCGAFAGMTSQLVLGHPAWVVLAGGLAGLVLSVLSDSWSGIGGKLGTIAFLGGSAPRLWPCSPVRSVPAPLCMPLPG